MAESRDSDGVGDWTLISDKLDENQVSSPNETVTKMNEINCPDSKTMENTDKPSVSNESEACMPVINKLFSNNESFNSDIDDNLSYPDISTGSSKSCSLDSYELYRESSPSSISGTSESSFSIIDQPCAACSLTPDILEGINEDMIDLSVVSSIQEELPSDIDLKPGRRHYIHTRNSHLNKWLNLIALLSAALALGLGVGNFIGMSRQWWHEREIARNQVLKLKQLQDELVLCIKEKTEAEYKILNLNEDFSNEDLNPFLGINDQLNVSERFDIQKNKKIQQILQEQNMFQAQEIKIYHLQEENNELRNTLQCLANQIESNLNSKVFDKNSIENTKAISINEKVKNVKDHINQMISENEELKTAVARLRYGDPLIYANIKSNTTVYNGDSELHNNTQNNTFTIVYNYWKEKFPIYDFRWVDLYLKQDNQDTKSFNQAINDVLSSLFSQVSFLTEDIYNKFNIQEIQMNIKNKLAELENFSSTFCGTDCAHTINKTTKKMKEMIYVAVQKCKKAIQKFKDNEKPYEFKTKKLYSKISEIFKKLDQKWSDIKERWSKKDKREEKIQKFKRDKYSHYSKTDYKFKEQSKETNFVPRDYVDRYSNVKRINGRGM